MTLAVFNVGAQSESPSAKGTLEEVVVTAQRRDENIQEVAIAVTAFDGETIQALGFNTPEDIAWQTPGLYARSTRGSNSNPIFALRGIGVNDQNSNNSPSISIYVDEVNQPFSPMLTFHLMDLERVEVLKGPQGSLYGKNTTGGAVNFITRKPSLEGNDGYARVNYEMKYRAALLEGAFGGPISDTVAGRIAFFGVNQDEGWQENAFLSKNVGDVRNGAVRGQLLWEPSSQFSALLSLSFGTSKMDGYINETISTLDRSAFPEPIVVGQFLGTGPICPAILANRRDEQACVNQMGYSDPYANPRVVDSPNDQVNEIDSTGLSLKLDWELDAVTITSVTGYNKLDQDLMDGYGTALIILESAFEDRAKAYSTELRLSGNNTEKSAWVVGGFLAREELDHRFIQSLDDWFFPFDAVGAQFRQRSESAAIFGHIEHYASEALTLGAGLRYTDEEKKQKDFQNFSYTNPPGQRFPVSPYKPVFDGGLASWPGATLLVDVDNEVSLEEWSGELFAKYTWTDDVHTYAKVSRGVKSGGFMGAISFSPGQASSFEPEEVVAYEIGLKSELLGRTMRFNAAAYYYDWKDFQARTLVNVGGIGLVILTNAGDAEIKGVEAEMLWIPSFVPGLSLLAGVNYIDAEIVKGEFKGDTPSSTPEWMLNGLARYDFQTSGSAFEPYIQASTSYQSTNYLTLRNIELHKNDAFWLVDARIGVRLADGRFDLAFWAKNIFDETYLANTADTGLVSFPSVNMYAPPRRYGIEFAYYF